MEFASTTEPAEFVERPNRYVVMARLAGGGIVRAHCPDPGRLRELLLPGVRIHISPAQTDGRRTTHDLRFVEHPETGTLISLDSRLPNALFREGLDAGWFKAFRDWPAYEREVTVPHAGAGIRSRIDYVLRDRSGARWWVEVKSATLVERGDAYFPDAVTERGRRHLLELMEIVLTGDRAAVCFIVQRPDARCVRPQWDRDPEFAQALVDAEVAGVALHACTVELTLERASLLAPIPVLTERYAWRTDAAGMSRVPNP